MRTFEMIKELEDNPDKKFRIQLRDHLIAYVNNDTGRINFVNTTVSKRDQKLTEFRLEIGDKWEELRGKDLTIIEDTITNLADKYY